MTYLTKTLTATGVLALAASAVHAQDTMTLRSNLAELYFDQAKAESTDWDIQDANYLQGRGVNALNGGPIAPRDWRTVPVVSANPADLEAARLKLIYASESGAVNQMPYEYSHALVAYDCWVGQQKAEPNASHNLDQCKDEYYYYAQNLPNPTTTVTKDVPMVMKELTKVYFAWDSYALSADAKAKLDSDRAMLLDAKNGKLIIGGYADASGSRAYNQNLSRKRAQAVANYLGLSPDRYDIDINAYGEDRLQVPTADGVREQANRVAIVGIRVVKDVPVTETKEVPGY